MLRLDGVLLLQIPTALSMNNMRKYFLLTVIVGAALWAALFFLKQNHSAKPASAEFDKAETEIIPAFPIASPKDSPNLEGSLPPAKVSSSINFSPRLQEIGQCLEIHNSLNDNARPTLEELQSSLFSSLGEVIETSLDWKNIHINLPNGEKRRIRIEVEADGEGAVRRQLQYYSVDTENLPVLIHLPPEQTENPTDTFIASLENEGQITLQEEARRGVYFQGAEIYYVERNGDLSEIEMNYRGKNVRCQDLNNERANCNCF